MDNNIVRVLVNSEEKSMLDYEVAALILKNLAGVNLRITDGDLCNEIYTGCYIYSVKINNRKDTPNLIIGVESRLCGMTHSDTIELYFPVVSHIIINTETHIGDMPGITDVRIFYKDKEPKKGMGIIPMYQKFRGLV